MEFNFNKFTVKAQETVKNAIEIAQNYNNQIVEPEHLLAAILQDESNVAVSIIHKSGANINQMRIKIGELLERLPKVSGSGIGNQQLSVNTAKLFDRSSEEAKTLKDEYVSNEHLLLALSEDKNASGKLLNENGIDKNTILTALKEIRGNQRVTSQNPEDTYQALQKYGRDLNELARSNKLDPVIGRDEEIRRVLQVLSRRTKNNPVLIGEPGVGK
ncbi:MAG: Clp protease N-terminal domain-containing protein, partial [Melioribacteraceae bacterium]